MMVYPILNHNNRDAGFGIIEMMVVVAIVGTTFASLYQLFALSTRPVHASVRETEAVYLAEEAIEAARILRNNSWTVNIATLTNSTTYYPKIAGGTWTLSTTNPGLISNLYTRTVVIAAVYRDVNDNITTSTGTLDPDTKKITATVSWSERGKSRQIVLEAYLTDFLNN